MAQALTVKTATELFDQGMKSLQERDPAWDKRERYLRGDLDNPFTPDGVNQEYKELQRQAKVNVSDLVINAPIQRMEIEGFRTGRDSKADKTVWEDFWQANKLDSRQKPVYREMATHGLGMMSVNVNDQNRKRPKIRPELARDVWMEPNPDDPWEHIWSFKRVQTRQGAKGYVYTDAEWVGFSQDKNGKWAITDGGTNPIGELPFCPFTFNVDAANRPMAPMDAFIPQQDAITTIRFNLLLAMQFSAFRQRVFTGYDPVIRDSKGEPLVKRDANGQPILDENGMEQPLVRATGRVGVDRALVFPGDQTKVYDLDESNLDNYIKVLDSFMTTFFATGHVPPQYALNKMANLSGDGMEGAEATFQSLIKDLQAAAGEGMEAVMRKANKAAGTSHEDLASEAIWGDSEVRSFAQIVDAVVKLTGTGFPMEDAWGMLPGATPSKVELWMRHAFGEQQALDMGMQEMAAKLEARAAQGVS